MRRVFVSIIVTLIIANCLYCYAATGKGLEFSIIFDKEEYTTKDQIKIDFKLENKGKKDVVVNTRFFLNGKESPREKGEVYLEVISPSGKELPLKHTRETGLPRTDDFVVLKPGEERSTKRPFNITYFYDFKTPGTYKITAVYQNVFGDEIGLKEAFKERLKSKEVIIKITE